MYTLRVCRLQIGQRIEPAVTFIFILKTGFNLNDTQPINDYLYWVSDFIHTLKERRKNDI